jgi:hypothetical protein
MVDWTRLFIFPFSVKYPDHPLKPLAVYAGLEPLEFTNLFPYWEVNGTARQLNIKVQLIYIFLYISLFLIKIV